MRLFYDLQLSFDAALCFNRCAQLTWSGSLESPSIWSDVILKMKEGISAAFISAVAQREEEVKRSESQRQMPGWNFCTFFVLKVCLAYSGPFLVDKVLSHKETLASSFEGMNLYEDAKIQYDELEASFFQVLKEKNLSFFGKIIEPNPKDDSLPLLSTTKKPYRDLILANAISVFDFRVYLIAQQCSLLGKLGALSDICVRVGIFLGSFAERLREVKVGQSSLTLFCLQSDCLGFPAETFPRVLDLLLSHKYCRFMRRLGAKFPT